MALLDIFKYPTYQEKYLAGFSEFKSPMLIQIMFKEGFIEIKPVGAIRNLLVQKQVILRPENIIEVSLNQSNYRHAGKTAVGAIVGGVLTGGVGLIAGAALGGKRRTENKLVLTVSFDSSREFHVFIDPSQKTTKLYSEFINFISKYDKVNVSVQENNQLLQPQTQPQLTDTIPTAINVADQLEKLHSLVDKGILTQQEFEEEKKKLLQR
jgi:Short C-terminal domain